MNLQSNAPASSVVAAVAAALLALPAAAAAAPHAPGEVVVRYAPGTTAHAASAGAPHVVRHVASVPKAIRALKRSGRVVYAVPNVRARAADFIPNDPGRSGTTPGGWQATQWNFTGPFSVNAPAAWANLIAAGRPGAKGVKIAVLDTGVAYKNRGAAKRSPDLKGQRFIRGYDFVDRDPYPLDRNGHGTHVASTIGEATNNSLALTGLAYGASIMPVRVLDAAGEGDASDIADGIRFAARKGADIINLSLEFSTDVRAKEIPELLDAIDYAHRKGALLIGASGNEGNRSVAYPARAGDVMSVAATTEHGCVSDFSNQGPGLDIAAPGGGADAPFTDDPNCRFDAAPGRDIFQVTLTGRLRNRFGIPSSYEGTSMAAPHVSATAALVIASGVLGPDPTPDAIERRLKDTARDLGPEGPDQRYGAGLIDAAAATAR